ncbi:MAG: arylsulfotransferase family protein [Ignavibacteria bacterium]|nr:arylsulfotransferase family protein [Ignavibacteria bacterium]
MSNKVISGAISAIFLLLASAYLNAQTIQYLSPKPNSIYNNEKSTIIIGFNSVLSGDFLKTVTLSVTGSTTGLHTGTIIPVEANRKLIFKPAVPFSLNETVTVSGIFGQLNYSFTIRKYAQPQNPNDNSEMRILNGENIIQTPVAPSPKDFPVFNITQNGPTEDGYLFLSNFSQAYGNNYLMVLNNNGTPHSYKALTANAYDFKRQKTNIYTYYEEMAHFYLGMDENYNVIDSFFCGNGYSTDIHECQCTADGGAWLLSYDIQTIDMSQIVSGGLTNAQVTGLIIQKIDANKNVVFQWSSWDYIPITDATHENLTAYNIDYMHGNALEPMDDNSVLLSSRHLDEITKISETTGDIIWRLGGKHNMFTFIGDTLGFSHQHYVRYIGNNHYTLFDNGNFHTPGFSRALEYVLDETNMTATLYWQFRHSPDIFAAAMGSVQRLANGNTLIGWGSASTTLSEVTPEGNLVYELSLPTGQMSYRAFRFELQPVTGTGNNDGIAKNYSLNQNYPNPFNPTTTIKFSIPSSSFVNLSVYDITGKKVGEILNGQMSAGQYSEKWDGSKFSSGVYFYVLKTNNFQSTKKMLLIK